MARVTVEDCIDKVENRIFPLSPQPSGYSGETIPPRPKARISLA